MCEEWTPKKDALRKQLNREFAKSQRDVNRVRKFGAKKYKSIDKQNINEVEQQ